jgi:hypothetical protein
MGPVSIVVTDEDGEDMLKVLRLRINSQSRHSERTVRMEFQ